MEQAGAEARGTMRDRFAGTRMFIPISLGNHYYSSEILNVLLSKFIAKSECSVIFLCDRLRFLSYQIRGEADEPRIVATIRLQLAQMNRTLRNLGLNSHPNAEVADWSFLQDDNHRNAAPVSDRRNGAFALYDRDSRIQRRSVPERNGFRRLPLRTSTPRDDAAPQEIDPRS